MENLQKYRLIRLSILALQSLPSCVGEFQSTRCPYLPCSHCLSSGRGDIKAPRFHQAVLGRATPSLVQPDGTGKKGSEGILRILH